MGFLDDYEPVEDRIRAFWGDWPQGRIVTRLLSHGDGHYVVQASVWRASEDDALAPAATGLAHEDVASLPNNMKASALEVCETSAIGRALANLGYAPKGKRPSREEMHKVSGSGVGGSTSDSGSSSAGHPASTGDSGSPADQTGSGRGEPGEAPGHCSHPTDKRRETPSGRIRCMACGELVD